MSRIKSDSNVDFQIRHLLPIIQSETESNTNPLSDLLFVIVLYDIDLYHSLTFQSLLLTAQEAYPGCQIDLLICDNSPHPQHISNDTYSNIYYLHDPRNPGVSVSYNRAASFAQSRAKKWLLIFDHDTKLPINSLQKYVSALENWAGYPLYAPQVFSNDKLLSPCHYLMYRGTHLQKLTPGVHKMQYRNVLNSGLLLDITAFKQVGGYDEQVWLYFSDFTFFNKLKKHYSEYVVLDCHLEHSLSSSDYDDFNFALKRFAYYCEGAKQASKLENNFFAYLSYGLTVGLRSFKMYRRFNDISFIKIYIKTFYSANNEN